MQGLVGLSHLQLTQQLSGGAWGPPRGRAVLGVQAGAELCQGLADGVGLFLELRSVGVKQSPGPPLPVNPAEQLHADWLNRNHHGPRTAGPSPRPRAVLTEGSARGHLWFTEPHLLSEPGLVRNSCTGEGRCLRLPPAPGGAGCDLGWDPGGCPGWVLGK